MDEIAGFFFFIYYQPQYKSAISAAELAKKGAASTATLVG